MIEELIKLAKLLVYCPDDGGLSRCALESIDITTRPYPGFPTDLQAQFMALITLAKGTSCLEIHFYLHLIHWYYRGYCCQIHSLP